MVARYEDDGLDGWVEKGIDAETAADPNGVGVYRHFWCNAGWQMVGVRWSRRKGPAMVVGMADLGNGG